MQGIAVDFFFFSSAIMGFFLLGYLFFGVCKISYGHFITGSDEVETSFIGTLGLKIKSDVEGKGWNWPKY